ncbi:MAG: zinc ABC transporter substrate-binding protein [Holosporales bacterium]
MYLRRFITGFVWLWATALHAKAPLIVASIPPVQAIVKEVVGELQTVEVLMAAQSSAHGYSLRPSDRRLIEAADRIYWIGPSYEGFLDKLARRKRKHFVALQDTPGLKLLPLRNPHHHHHPSHAHAHHKEHRHAHHHAHNIDGHIWLDPDHGALMAEAIAKDLAHLDPQHADQYRANATALKERLKTLKQEITSQLSGIAGIPLFTFHDGYQYFERAFGLPVITALAEDPDQPIAPKALHTFQKSVQQAGSACILREHQFPQGLKALKNKARLHEAVVNPYGEGTHQVGAYENLLKSMGGAIASCATAAKAHSRLSKTIQP